MSIYRTKMTHVKHEPFSIPSYMQIKGMHQASQTGSKWSGMTPVTRPTTIKQCCYFWKYRVDVKKNISPELHRLRQGWIWLWIQIVSSNLILNNVSQQVRCTACKYQITLSKWEFVKVQNLIIFSLGLMELVKVGGLCFSRVEPWQAFLFVLHYWLNVEEWLKT